uniref:Uncharacterized protein n=1 Tax=Arundo donax TaxID=35708 RepID=A0A0A9ENU2_ARUDO
MALSLSQVGSHLASTLGADAHGHHQDLLRLGGGSAATRGFDHLLGPPSASAFRPLPPPPASAFLMGAPQEFGDGDGGNGSHGFLQGKPFHGLMHLPDLQGNGAGGPPASSAPGLFNLGYIANSANSSGTSSHGHASQGHMTSDQFSEGGGGGGGGGSESSAAMLFGGGGGNFAGGDHQVAPGGMYNEQAVMLPQMSATALLQKASQMGSNTSAHGGASVFGGLVGSSAPSAPHGQASMVDQQSQIHLQNLMNSLAGGGGMFGGSSSGAGMIDPRLYDMDHKVKFSQGGRGDADMTRDFLGVGAGGVMRGMPVARGEHHDGAGDMSSLEAEMKSASSSFTGGRMQ